MAILRPATFVYLFVIILAFVLLALLLPAIKSRRPVPIGIQDGTLRPCPDSPNCVHSRGTDGDHRIAPLVWTGSAAKGMDKLRGLIERMPGARIVTCHADYLHAEFRSRVFGFVDDIEFLADPENDAIDVRSASRVGYSDMGANRQRVETIRRLFERP